MSSCSLGSRPISFCNCKYSQGRLPDEHNQLYILYYVSDILIVVTVGMMTAIIMIMIMVLFLMIIRVMLMMIPLTVKLMIKMILLKIILIILRAVMMTIMIIIGIRKDKRKASRWKDKIFSIYNASFQSRKRL